MAKFLCSSSVSFVVVALLVAGTKVESADPSGGWLSYAVYNAPNPTDIVTKLSATMVVPDKPKSPFGSPAFWFGVQTAKGDGALIQPIMAKWLGDSFYMFQEIFDWTDQNDEQSHQIKVKAGEIIHASVTYVPGKRSYIMNMTSQTTGMVSNYHYDLLPQQTATESAGYFVLEHQPQSCKELPSSGKVRWTNITVEVNNEVVQNAVWTAKEEGPDCGSKAVVVDSSTIDITWTPAN